MPNLRGWELVILVLLVLLLFGSKKLPDAARGVGRSLRIFKAETKGLVDDDEPAAEDQQAQQQQATRTPELTAGQDDAQRGDPQAGYGQGGTPTDGRAPQASPPYRD